MYVTAIVLAAGKGLRFKSRISKPLVYLDKKPVIIHSLLVLSQSLYIRDIILVVNRVNKAEILAQVKKYRIPGIKQVILGGKRRQDSVLNGLKVLDRKTDLVLIHDGVRPFIDKESISRLIKQAVRNKAAVLGVPVKATIKKIRKNNTGSGIFVAQTVKRDDLWEIQTPQVFEKELLCAAYRRFIVEDFTDDAMLIERLNKSVSVVRGTYENIKITTPEDLVIAQAILENNKGKDKGN